MSSPKYVHSFSDFCRIFANRHQSPDCMEFKYKALQEPGHIRLLKLESKNARKGVGLLKCWFHEYALDEAPEYAAISYTWKEDVSGFRVLLEILYELLKYVLQHPFGALYFVLLLSLKGDMKSSFHCTVHKRLNAVCDALRDAVRRKYYDLRFSYSVRRILRFLRRHHALLRGHYYRRRHYSSRLDESLSTRLILCDGKKMRITTNLYNALRHLPQTSTGYYWTDQICAD